jgi:hypothetical protein
MECEFCKKTLSNKSNLTNHQKTNKKCLSAQEKEGRQLNEIKLKLNINFIFRFRFDRMIF